MASTAADIIASAKAEAEAAKQSALSSLSGLGTDITNAYNQQQAATTSAYQNTLNQLQQAYQRDTKAAYGNYMTEKQNLNNQLNRLGLQNTGYGVSQGLIAGSAYSKNLAALQSALSTNQANTNVQQQQALADLYSNYAKNKLNVDQYLYEAGQNAYDRMYSNAYQAMQDEIANSLEQQQLQLQQQYYNYLMSQGSGGGGYSSGGRSGSGGSSKSSKKNSSGEDELNEAVEDNQTSNNSGISIKVTDTGKNLTSKLSGLKNFVGGEEIMKKELQNQYNAGNITAGDVNFAINRLKLR